MGQQDWNQLGKHIFKPNAPIDARELVNSDSDIVNIDSAYVGMIVTVNSNPIKRYKIKKVTWEGHPDSLENGGYELIQEPKDLKYSDGVTPFLNNNGNIDADYLKFADIDGSEEEKSTEDDFNVKTDTLRIDGTTYENSKKQSIRNTIGAQENITSMQNVQPVIEALNNRTAKIDQQTSEIIALGYKVLNPNKSFAEQVTAANTVYEIRDEFEVAGSATIPANCTLKFNGGKLKNGTIVGNNTTISGDKFFLNEDIVLNGTFSNQEIYLNWFVFTKFRFDELYNIKLTDISDVLVSVLAIPYKKIILPSGDFISDVSSTRIANGTQLIGDSQYNTRLYLNATGTPKYYIGLKYASAIMNICIIVYETRDIPIIFSSSILTNGNSDWHQSIYNIWLQNRSFTKLGNSLTDIHTTAIKLSITPFDENGNLVADKSNYALSYRGNYDLIHVQYFDTCFELHLDDSPNIPDSLKPKIWCNSVFFSRLTAWGRIGFKGSGKASGRTVVSQYLFQIAGTNGGFGIYGNFNDLFVDNYTVWDTSYRGKANGVIIDPQVTAYNGYINRNSGYIKLDNNKKLFVYNTSPYISTLALTTRGVSGEWENPYLYKKMADSSGYGGIEEVFGDRLSTNNKPLVKHSFFTKNNDSNLSIFTERYLFDNIEVLKRNIKGDGTVNITTKNGKDVYVNGYKISGIKSGLFADKGRVVGESRELYYATDKKVLIIWTGTGWINVNGDFVYDSQGTKENRFSIPFTSLSDGYQYREIEYSTETTFTTEDDVIKEATKLLLQGIKPNDIEIVQDEGTYKIKHVVSESHLLYKNAVKSHINYGYWIDCSTGTYYIDEEGNYLDDTFRTKYYNKSHAQIKIFNDSDPFFNDKILFNIWAIQGFSDTNLDTFKLDEPVITFIDDGNTHKATLSSSSTTARIAYKLTGDGITYAGDGITYTRGTEIVFSEGDQLKAAATLGNKASRSSDAFTKVVIPEIEISDGVMTITCAADDATIYYTIDGSAPTRQSTEYTGSVNVQEGTTVKAMAVLIGRVNSDIATKTY